MSTKRKHEQELTSIGQYATTLINDMRFKREIYISQLYEQNRLKMQYERECRPRFGTFSTVNRFKNKHEEQMKHCEEEIDKIEKELSVHKAKNHCSLKLQQKVDAIKKDIETDQNLLLQNITQAEVEDLPEIYQQLDTNLHIKCINELLLQLDTLMKELTIYGENDVVKTLKSLKQIQ